MTSSFPGRATATAEAPLGGRKLVLAPGDQDRDRLRRSALGRFDQGELVVEIAGILDQAHHCQGVGVDVQGAADADIEDVCYGVGHGHLAGRGRVTALYQSKHRGAERPVRVLGP
jgi:hypothetical protein